MFVRNFFFQIFRIILKLDGLNCVEMFLLGILNSAQLSEIEGNYKTICDFAQFYDRIVCMNLVMYRFIIIIIK